MNSKEGPHMNLQNLRINQRAFTHGSKTCIVNLKKNLYMDQQAFTHKSTTLHMDTKEFIYDAKRAFTSGSKASGIQQSYINLEWAFIYQSTRIPVSIQKHPHVGSTSIQPSINKNSKNSTFKVMMTTSTKKKRPSWTAKKCQ